MVKYKESWEMWVKGARNYNPYLVIHIRITARKICNDLRPVCWQLISINALYSF